MVSNILVKTNANNSGFTNFQYFAITACQHPDITSSEKLVIWYHQEHQQVIIQITIGSYFFYLHTRMTTPFLGSFKVCADTFSVTFLRSSG